MNFTLDNTSLPPLHQDYLIAALSGLAGLGRHHNPARSHPAEATWKEIGFKEGVTPRDVERVRMLCPICNPKPAPTDEELGSRAKWTARERRGRHIWLDYVRLPVSVREATRASFKARVGYLIDHCYSCKHVLWAPVEERHGREVAV